MATLQDILARRSTAPIPLDAASPLMSNVGSVDAPVMPSLQDMVAPASAPVSLPVPMSNTDQRISDDKGTLQGIQDKLANPYGSAKNHPGIIGNILHGLSVAGQIAGGVVAPEILPFIPGTRANLSARQDSATGDLSAAEQTKTAELGQAQQQATTDYTQQRPEIENAKIQQKQLIAQNNVTKALASKGIVPSYDENGILTDVSDDKNSEAYQRNVALDVYHKAIGDKADIDAEIAQNKYVVGTPEYNDLMVRRNQADKRLQIGLAGLTLRKQGLQLRQENQAAQNTGIDPQTGKPFAGAQQIADADGNITTVGSRFAAGAEKAQGKASQMNDVHGALDNMDSAAEALAAKNGGALNTPGVVAALTAAHDSSGRWITGGIANYLKSSNKAALSPEERNYVQAIEAGHENVQAMRGSIQSGPGSDTQLNRLDAMVPGAETPDLNYFHGQTSQIRSTADRLAPGVATVAGGLSVRGKGNASPAKTSPQASTSGPKEGQTKTNSAGDKIVFRKGSWGPA